MKNNIILFTILTGILFSSCDAALDVQPENYLFEDQLVTDDKSAQTSLVGVYTQLNWTYYQYLEVMLPLMDGSLTTTNSTWIFGEASDNSFDSSQVSLNTVYEWPYYITNSANATISAVTDNASVSAGEHDRILSEAIF
ncbi:hypothetical protein JCM19274_2228 [Algibacter lectus]|uniref:Outer membrane protein n=1 Tax=Algibacter lectus TaxID=221126 RepID=A0A090X062_9FLAO|nr:hypothetical protein [Algibacter lectus]GAL81054.1 hypothetical protein JCM19274_2228 [Algibacter lectus]